jgi:hypothetical protein
MRASIPDVAKASPAQNICADMRSTTNSRAMDILVSGALSISSVLIY